MISKEHNNHKNHHPNQNFARIEIGFWGIGCTAMQQLYTSLTEANTNYKIGFYDIKHEEKLEAITTLNFNNVQLQLPQTISQYQINQFFNAADVVIINGNHHHSNNMWLILDGKKDFKPNDEHLEKTSIIFYNEQTKQLAKQLKEIHPSIQLISECQFDSIHQQLNALISKHIPTLSGIILTGGESTRMKENKSLIVYHKEPQWLHLYHLLNNYCEVTFVSCTEKNAELYDGKALLTDTFLGLGPLSGILTALRYFKNKAVLILACDLPLIDDDAISQLVEERDASKMATTFLNSESNFLEPLITIYEPKALPIMLTMMAQGYTCPRKMLMQNEIKVIHPKNATALKNINHPEEKNQILNMLLKSENI